MSHCRFIPPYLLDRVASVHTDTVAARTCQETLAIDHNLRERRLTPPPVIHGATPSFVEAEQDAWTIFTADHGSDLPGRPVRSAGEPVSGDLAVDEAYVGVEASMALFRGMFGRDSYDGRGAPVVATVHFEKNYDNAFWDGRQLVFGDGDGRVFGRFTKPIDVLAHEFTHAVTQYTSGFAYQGQPGALNESMSDVFAACVKQWTMGQSAADADWLIGEGIFMPTVNARALRSMAAPGTAYDDPVVGSDPQVGHMSDFVVTTHDNGGVHLNSGIPNRAFYLVATRLGGMTWERAGQIWYAALTSESVGVHSDFAAFARATLGAAGDAQGVVAQAWAEVGVDPLTSAPGTGPADEGAEELVKVTRSGGFAGRTVRGAVSAGEDPRAAEVQQLLERIDFAAVAPEPPQPDRFVYSFCVRGSAEVTVPEQSLTPELSRLAHLVLDDLR